MLRIRTGYSFRTASGELRDVLNVLIEKKFTCAPITDRASTFGWIKWDRLARAAGLRPIFGVELAVSPDPLAKKPIVDYWTFIAKDNLQPLNLLTYEATAQFRYQPLLTYEQALKADAIKIIGHRARPECIEPVDDLFFALGPSTARGYARALRDRGVKPLASADNRYARPGDRSLWEIIAGRGAERQAYPQHILSSEEWRTHMADAGFDAALLDEALANADAATARSTAVLTKATLLKPQRDKTLLEMCHDGARKLGVNLNDPVYNERLERELRLIQEKNFDDYFYIVSDICLFARAHMLVGPARGSSCGSLVCYLLGITLVDPIPFGLMFERFIDITREDLPDIDIDFSDEKRERVFDYVIDKYGAHRAARLGTVSMFKPRLVLREAGAALRIPSWMTEAAAGALSKVLAGDARALKQLEDTLQTTPAGKALLRAHPEFAACTAIEGHPRHYGQHAAGIVLAEEAISKYVAVNERTGATMCDKNDAEAINLLKIDALGLTQLSIFEDVLKLAHLPLSVFDNLRLDDPLIFELFNAHKFFGIFQFNGAAAQNIAKQFKFESFNDIVCATALARPGPMGSGATAQWLKRRNGREEIRYPHESFEPALRETLGVTIYQEQIMQIGREVGGLDWAQVTGLRKAMSKSAGNEVFDRYGESWKAGAIATGIAPENAERIWRDMCAFGAYGFNKSHAVAYAIISYQCAWLKAYYPVEFAAASLSHEHDPLKQLLLLREVVNEGVEYVAVDANLSRAEKWTVTTRDGRKKILGPLTNIKGIGPKFAQAIEAGRNAREERFLPTERLQKMLMHPVTAIDSLYPIRDAINRLLPDPTQAKIISKPTAIESIKINDQPIIMFVTPTRITPRDDNDPAKVATRGYKIEAAQTMALNMFVRDDSGEIFARVNREDFEKLGKPIIEYGRPGKALWCLKGVVKQTKDAFRIFSVNKIRFIGDMEPSTKGETS